MLFFSLIQRARVIANIVDSRRLTVDADYRQNVIQYLSQGKALNLRHRDGSVETHKIKYLPFDAAKHEDLVMDLPAKCLVDLAA